MNRAHDALEHPVEQPIIRLDVEADFSYIVGVNCTRIEATTKSGMYANIAYLRPWNGDVALSEFCQHNVLGVYFQRPAQPTTTS